MAAMLEDLVIGTKMRYASCIYNIYIPLILWVQAPKNFLKENEVILSVDISKNYQNKQCHKIQNAFFGHENFTLFTAASYFHRQLSILKASPAILRQLSILRASCLVIVPAAVVSNETSHSHNVTFTNKNKLIFFVQEINPAVDTFHFWSDGCARQFRSTYVFSSFFYYPVNIKLTSNYGEAHDFKGMLNCHESVLYCSSKYLTLNCWLLKSWMPVTRQTTLYNFNYTMIWYYPGGASKLHCTCTG